MKKKRTRADEAIDRELIVKGREALRDFDESQALYVPAKKSESKLISIRLPMTMMNELRDLAIKRGDVGYQQLIKIFIAEGLLRSQFETSSHALMGRPRFRTGDQSDLDGSFSLYPDMQPPLSGVSFDPVGTRPYDTNLEKRKDLRWKWTSRF